MTFDWERKPRATWKFYIAEGRDYLEMVRTRSWEDASGGLVEYSELQKPYLRNKPEDDSYQMWEWTWPDDWWPDPPPGIVWPDPVGPCDEEDECSFAQIFGRVEIDCGDCATYSQLHIFLGCAVAPWWAAYGGWEFETDNDCIQLITSGPVIATVCAEATCQGSYTIRYIGPLDCTDELHATVTCADCCEEFTLTGSDTVNPSSTWTGTVSPACPDATCSVVSDSGCTLSCAINGAGSSVTVTPGASDCGTFTVTVDSPAISGCIPHSASKVVRINNTGQGGAWSVETPQTNPTCNPVCNVGCGTVVFGPCTSGETGKKYGRGAACATGFDRGCRGCRNNGCGSSQPSSRPPCSAAPTCETSGVTSGFCGGSGSDQDCLCTQWRYAICKWSCSC